MLTILIYWYSCIKVFVALYIKNVSERVARILKQFNIRLSHRLQEIKGINYAILKTTVSFLNKLVLFIK